MSLSSYNNAIKWLQLHLVKDVGPKTFANLLEAFGDIDGVLSASIYKLAMIKGISQKKAEFIYYSMRDDSKARYEYDLACKLGIEILTIADDDYPPLLKQIDDPPHVLYVKGDIVRSDNLSVAIVGSRTCSQYGYEQASRLSHLLAAAGVTVISGLARGIDTVAHRGAIAGGGRTIAVQGRGLGGVFPPENEDLAEIISANGAVVSELPVSFEPIGSNFPARNRIIAGMSLATIIVEARKRGGALITARLAQEYNREVMAVPGRVDNPCSEGPNTLIREGATLVTGIDDIMEALGSIGSTLKDYARDMAGHAQSKLDMPLFSSDDLNLTDDERLILDKIESEPIHIDAVIYHSGRKPGLVNSVLTSLQLKGLIRQMPGGFFVRKPGKIADVVR